LSGTDMKNELKEWLEKDGEKFLKSIGVKNGDIVLDFGSGVGHYTIPAAKVVGEKGKVYAFDKDKVVLSNLKHMIIQKCLKNVKLAQANTEIPLDDNSIDIVLCFDVIHYFRNRKAIYDEFYRVLKTGGLFALYPKHYRDDYPLMELADMRLEDIINEVEKAGFVLRDRIIEDCFHDNYYNKCQVLNFNKIGRVLKQC